MDWTPILNISMYASLELYIYSNGCGSRAHQFAPSGQIEASRCEEIQRFPSFGVFYSMPVVRMRVDYLPSWKVRMDQNERSQAKRKRRGVQLE